MSILKRAFAVKDTHEQIRSDFHKGYDTQVEQLDQPYEYQQVFEYKALLRIRFAANKTDYDMALENAKLQMQDYMYSEVLLALRKIQSCVYSGDAHATLKEIDRIRTSIMEIDNE